jgi:hypothetical protein
MNITYQIRRDFYCVHLFFIFTRDWYSVPISPAISMALQDFSFYFLISNLVAVVLSFSEGGSKHNWEHKKCAIPLFTFLYPLELAPTVPISPSESWGGCRAFLMALQKKDLVLKNHKKWPLDLRPS